MDMNTVDIGTHTSEKTPKSSGKDVFLVVYPRFETDIVGWPIVLINCVVKKDDGQAYIPNLGALEAAVLRHRVKQPIRFRPWEILCARKIMGETAASFANKLQIRPDYLSKLENGHHPMSASTEILLRLAVVSDKKLEQRAPLIRVSGEEIFSMELAPFTKKKSKPPCFQLVSFVAHEEQEIPEEVYREERKCVNA